MSANRALTLSPSTLKTYARCRYAYALDKIVKVPRSRRVIAAQLHTGRAVHTVLEQLLQQEQLQPEAAAQALERTFSWNAYEDREVAEDAYLTARERLSDWLGKPYGWGEGEQLAIEKMLRTKTHALTGEPSAPGWVLMGKPDLVRVHPDGALEVIDHKSGSHIPDAEALKWDFQAGVYRLLAQERWPTYPAYRISFSYLATGTVIPLTYEAAEVEQWWDILQGIAGNIAHARRAVENNIALEDAFVPNPGPQCPHCTFQRVCRFRAYPP
ncbi:RecB family exonuclease [Gloeobacter kilaueensis]|uniref:ATP-dependent nuclease, subunit B n=1 Tax=Gloeobacter kilaueensis (strain ATCC BAA-2537 / CCAP 1431/1 / ULC 316 / JS1) TaxID=1183438 RepID=U5QGU0_GLOK1|nr:PD-(D/E)XK nuclease family protein [Gloeobacter kilaueensis]AGY56814.1 ATP-dependent nuclease, subunit B [Gloeobacter kilaueensis JS1]